MGSDGVWVVVVSGSVSRVSGLHLDHEKGVLCEQEGTVQSVYLHNDPSSTLVGVNDDEPSSGEGVQSPPVLPGGSVSRLKSPRPKFL